MRPIPFLPVAFCLIVGGCISPQAKPLADVKADAKVGLTNTTQEQQTRQGGTAGGDLTQTSNDSLVVKSLIRWGGAVGLALVGLVAWMIWRFGYRPGNWQRKDAWHNAKPE